MKLELEKKLLIIGKKNWNINMHVLKDKKEYNKKFCTKKHLKDKDSKNYKIFLYK